MPTNMQGSTARQLQDQQITYIARDVTFADNAVARQIGILPAGARIHRALSGVQVHQAFNAGTTNVIDIGTAADDDFYATDLALGTVAFVANDENVSQEVTADTVITATVGLAGTAATTGRATVIIAYYIPG